MLWDDIMTYKAPGDLFRQTELSNQYLDTVEYSIFHQYGKKERYVFSLIMCTKPDIFNCIHVQQNET